MPLNGEEMNNTYTFLLLAALLAAVLFGGACSPTRPVDTGGASSTTVIAPETATPTRIPIDRPVPTQTRIPVDRLVYTQTPIPIDHPVPTSTMAIGLPPYVDNRSSGSDLMISYVNAINRREYARAYSYWLDGATQLPSYEEFAQGYAGTGSVKLRIGTVDSNSGAGQLYWMVQVVMIAATSSHQTRTYVGCYVTHLGQPGNHGGPTFNHPGIQSAIMRQIANDSDASALLVTACNSMGKAGSPLPAQPSYAPDDISAYRYLDDLSTPVEVLRSYFNAINRREYVRAYSYWKPSAAAVQLQPYDQFAKGYQDTQSVQLIAGQVISDVGAGQIYYAVPVTLAALTTAGTAQSFVGCYRLHLAQPGNYGASSFEPLTIVSASIRKVSPGTETAGLMSLACQ